MDIKGMFKDKKTMAIFGIAGGVAGLLVYMTKGNNATNTDTVSTGSEDTANQIASVSDTLQNQQQDAYNTLSQQMGSEIEQVQSNFATLTDQNNTKYEQLIEQLQSSMEQSQSGVLTQLTDLQNKVNNSNQTVNPSIPTTVKTSSDKITIYGGGADYKSALAKYGNNPNINVVDTSHMDTSAIQFKSSDIVLGGITAVDSEGNHGVNTNSGEATRLVGQTRTDTAKLLDDYMNNINKESTIKNTITSVAKKVTSSVSKSSSSSNKSTSSDGRYTTYTNAQGNKVVRDNVKHETTTLYS